MHGSHSLAGHLVVFTGKLSSLGRKEARALLGKDPQVEPRLVALLDDSRQSVRAGAAEWLAERKDASAPAALWARLKKEKSELARAALLTGKTPALLRMTFIAVREADNSRQLIEPSPVLELPESEVTIAELLKSAGYATAHFGKWHVGRANPTRHGFDENDGANGSGGPNTTNPKQVYLTTELGIDFVSRQTKAGKPFLRQICVPSVGGRKVVEKIVYANRKLIDYFVF